MGGLFTKNPEDYMRYGCSYFESKQFHKAIENFQEALKLAEEQKNDTIASTANYMLGDAHRFKNQPLKAIEHYEECLKFARKQKEDVNETISLIALGRCLQR